MANQIIILVTDRGDPKHGEITVLDDAEKAERLVETLLEAGFEQERIRILTGDEVLMKVTYRPVVEISGDAVRDPEDGAGSASGDERPEARVTHSNGEKAPEAVSASAYSPNGITFSSQFRPVRYMAPQIGLRRGMMDVVS